MKIIGQSENGYIVAMSANELANACGFYSEYDKDWHKFLDDAGALQKGYGSDGKLKMGCDVPLGDWWHMLRDMRSKAAELNKLGESLRGFADICCGIMPMIKTRIEESAK